SGATRRTDDPRKESAIERLFLFSSALAAAALPPEPTLAVQTIEESTWQHLRAGRFHTRHILRIVHRLRLRSELRSLTFALIAPGTMPEERWNQQMALQNVRPTRLVHRPHPVRRHTHGDRSRNGARQPARS